MIHEVLENNRLWLLVLTIPSCFAFTALLMYMARKMASKKLEGLARAFNSEIVMGILQDPYIRLHNDGVETRIGVTNGSRNSPPYLILKQMTPIGFNLSIYKGNIITRGLGSIGLLEDVRMGDPVFDEKYLIRSNDPLRAQDFLQHSARREMTEFFFDEGFDTVKANKDGFIIMKPSFKKEDLEEERILLFLDKMRKLVSG